MRLILLWVLNALALMGVAYLMPWIEIASFGSALLAAVVLGLVNALLRPILIVLTLPVTLLTLGLFVLVVNGLMFWLAGSLLEGFVVSGFWPGLFGAILYSVFSSIFAALLPFGRSRQ
ncbi:phage holin family protein [Accumulibacter sp.]|uniref:phage holin family protein n=1 Tax=Accumulibacter sp. TaxID=2053492 RepID=UPI0025CD082A|nr:phage holin family protein [Accumulibacter sp.]MCM8595680.1 phage holin family protein [Accumulibacter sp.]MCM8627760.1 phage holin family protein [Accumulibacter sp.]MDS4049827.1 phage holin family protein [Accumulibacter sp.]